MLAHPRQHLLQLYDSSRLGSTLLLQLDATLSLPLQLISSFCTYIARVGAFRKPYCIVWRDGASLTQGGLQLRREVSACLQRSQEQLD